MMEASAQVHASAVSVHGKGCLITGASGTGKSTLCFELMALGADLIADDRVDLSIADESVLMSCPDAIRGVIEARGVGLIRTRFAEDPVACSLIVDLDHTAERIPLLQKRDLLGIPCGVINGAKRSGIASVIYVLLSQGRLLDPERDIKP